MRNRTTLLILVCMAVVLCVEVSAQEQTRELGTIGPPPRKNPERQTAAEGFPPLPLPVTPLRRSEPKAEPQAPIFVGRLTYGTYQDYMPNPGDLDNLMRHVRYNVGLWYGQRLVPVEELVAGHLEGKPCRVPMLYVTGYHPFELTDEQRAALRGYLVNGGTLMGDATLGSPAFAESFANEIRKMFPQRQFDVLQVDHPVFRAFYPYTNVHYFEVEAGWQQSSQGPPQLLGMNIGTRTAVILTPFDMTCGWDEFYAPDSSVKAPNAPRTQAIIPGDAIRLGINIVSYVAALRQVADVESVTREIAAPAERPRQQFMLAQLRHDGDWNPDPNSTYQWLRHLSTESSLDVDFDLKSVDANETHLAPYPFVFMTGFRNPRLSDKEVEALRRHIQAGGFLFINNCSGYQEFDRHARNLVARLFPDQELQPVGQEHPLMKAFFPVTEVRDRISGAPRAPELEGITIRDRLVLVYSKNDMITQMKQVSDPFGNGYDADSCRRLALNVVAYALQS